MVMGLIINRAVTASLSSLSCSHPLPPLSSSLTVWLLGSLTLWIGCSDGRGLQGSEQSSQRGSPGTRSPQHLGTRYQCVFHCPLQMRQPAVTLGLDTASLTGAPDMPSSLQEG